MKKFIIIILLSIFCLRCIPILPVQKYNPHYIAVMTGDCVERMIVIRSDLIKQGYKVKLIVGKLLLPNGEIIGHAWVKYKDKKTGKWISIYNY